MIPYWQKIIDLHYPADRKVRGILLSHSESVARLAIEIARSHRINIDEADIENAAMLHDIGIITTDAPGIDCFGPNQYLAHGVAGADMLRADNAPEKYALVAERHTGAGLTHDEITAARLPLPLDRSYMPQSTLEKLICYADCFYSKGGDGKKKDLLRVEASMARFGAGVLDRFRALHAQFTL